MQTPEINGKPAVWIQVGAAEKVNIGNFSNVDVGPVVLGKWVEDLPLDELRGTIQELQEYVELIVADERAFILKSIAESKD